MHERMLDKSVQPTDADMTAVIGNPIAAAWTTLRRFLVDTYAVSPVYNSGGKKYGWNLQYRSGGRPLCELYPENGSFTVLVILGKVELDAALAKVDAFGLTIQHALKDSPRFHDGCWMYIRVKDAGTCLKDEQDIEQLILIKKKPPRKKT